MATLKCFLINSYAMALQILLAWFPLDVYWLPVNLQFYQKSKLRSWVWISPFAMKLDGTSIHSPVWFRFEICIPPKSHCQFDRIDVTDGHSILFINIYSCQNLFR
ncbi:unnamed protein product [Albugo candida]|uniref:Uncharacterized protein n=1 Tax=Albugo candida TaxID=65357 RepID=A0A024GN31_9STRA|nr:unnamed protein product [Albugo candida]|eukprot:CCI47760.1 unnamed protein product [Albugo candida]